MYIYILLDTVLATDVDKYSLATARCQPIWRTLAGERDLFLAVAKDCGIVVYVNQSRAAATADPVDVTVGRLRRWPRK